MTALKEKITECDTQKQADKESLKTMQMMVDTLTENKLDAANKIADLERSVKKVNQQLSSHNEVLAKLSALEIENVAKGKQIQRLTDENEEQEMDLRKLDEKLAKVSELSQRQTQELLLLEQSIDKRKAMEDAYHKLQLENKELQSKVEAVQSVTKNGNTIPIDQHEAMVNGLQMERDENRRLYEEIKSQLAALNEELAKMKANKDDDDEKIDVLKEQLKHENEQLKKRCDEQTYKIDKYKGKVCEFSSKLKEVKQSKKILADTVFEYSKSVTKWHVQISHASKLLVKEVDNLNKTKAELEEKVEMGESTVQELRKTIDELELRLEDAIKRNDSDDVKEKYEVMLTEYKSLQTDIENKNSEIANLTQEWEQICTSLKEENEMCGSEIEKLVKECQNKSQQISELEQREALAITKNAELSGESSRLADTLRELQKTIDELKARQDSDANKNNETNDIKEQYEQLLTKYKSLQKEIEDKNSELDNLNCESERISALLKGENEKLLSEVQRLNEESQLKSQQITDIEEKESLANSKYAKLLDESNEMVQELKKAIDISESRLAAASKNDKISEKYEKLKTEHESLQSEIEEKNSEIDNLKQELERISMLLKGENEKLASDVKRLDEESQAKSGKLSDLEEQATLANNQNAELCNEKDALNETVQGLRRTIGDLESRVADTSQTDEINVKYQKLQTKYEAIQKEIENKNSEIDNITAESRQISDSLKEQIEQQVSQIEKLTEECEAKSRQIAELEESEGVSNKKNAELLAEMRELNDVLKKRGEVISNQNAEIDQLKSKLDWQSKQINSLEEGVKEKSKIIDQIRNQLDNQSEVLSTSTISRADEVARMRDIEDSFEEKYNKLRGLALKLKKKIAEQQAIIAKHESAQSVSTETTTSPPAAVPTPTPAQAQNLILMQKENDRLLDQIDAMKSEQKQYKSEINQLNQQIKKVEEDAKSLRIVNEDIKATADANLKIKGALDEQIRAGEKQIETLKNENRSVTQQLKNAENEIIKIKGESFFKKLCYFHIIIELQSRRSTEIS